MYELEEYDCIWIEFTSLNGNKFEIGYPGRLGFNDQNINNALLHNKQIKTLNKPWIVDHEPYAMERGYYDWTYTDQKRTHQQITAFKLRSCPPEDRYKYMLEFLLDRSEQSGTHIIFTDESGDQYSCNLLELQRSIFV